MVALDVDLSEPDIVLEPVGDRPATGNVVSVGYDGRSAEAAEATEATEATEALDVTPKGNTRKTRRQSAPVTVPEAVASGMDDLDIPEPSKPLPLPLRMWNKLVNVVKDAIKKPTWSTAGLRAFKRRR